MASLRPAVKNRHSRSSVIFCSEKYGFRIWGDFTSLIQNKKIVLLHGTFGADTKTSSFSCLVLLNFKKANFPYSSPTSPYLLSKAPATLCTKEMFYAQHFGRTLTFFQKEKWMYVSCRNLVFGNVWFPKKRGGRMWIMIRFSCSEIWSVEGKMWIRHADDKSRGESRSCVQRGGSLIPSSYHLLEKRDAQYNNGDMKQFNVSKNTLALFSNAFFRCSCDSMDLLLKFFHGPNAQVHGGGLVVIVDESEL